MNEKPKTRQIQVVLGEQEMAALKAAVQKAGMKQKYWVRQIVLEAINNKAQDKIEHQGGIS